MRPERDDAQLVGAGRQGKAADEGNVSWYCATLATTRAIDPACTCSLGSPCRTCLGWDAKIRRVERRHAAVCGWRA